VTISFPRTLLHGISYKKTDLRCHQVLVYFPTSFVEQTGGF